MKQKVGQDTFGNNATAKILGVEYQKLIAIEKCLGGKLNDLIFLECFGDVAVNKNETVEVKHHEGDSSLTDCSIDFWKTFRNLVREKNLIEQFTRLILHTTSTVSTDSVFHKWEDLSPERKYQKLKGVNITDTIREMFEEIFCTDEETLKKILGKFQIESSQPKIQEKLEELKQHVAMLAIPVKYKDSVIQQLIGYITKKAIDNRYKWHIERNSFERDFQYIIRPYLQEDIVFPFIGKHEIDLIRRDFIFVEEMKKIKYEKKIQQAVSDYLRASESRIMLIEDTPIIVETLDLFDGDLKDDIFDKKITHANGLTLNMLDTDIAHQKSKNMYDSCTTMSKKSIRGVQDIEMYYQNGRIHSIVEDGLFKWVYEEADL